MHWSATFQTSQTISGSTDHRLATAVLERFISTPYDCDIDIFYNSSIIITITFLITRCRQNIMFNFIQCCQKMRQHLNELRRTNREGSTMSMSFPSQIIFFQTPISEYSGQERDISVINAEFFRKLQNADTSFIQVFLSSSVCKAYAMQEFDINQVFIESDYSLY